MIERTVQLRYTPHPLRAASAWLVASPDPAVWLHAAAGCDSQVQAALRLLMIPTAPYSQVAGGALLFLPESDGGALRALHETPLCVPYGQIGPRLFAPIEATFDPDLSDDELHAILSTELTYVWHPTAGLVGFERHEQLALFDFLDAGPAVDRRWDRATAGAQLSPRLRSMRPSESPGLQAVLEQGKGDIGSEGQEFGRLPPESERPQPSVGHTAMKAGLNILGAGIAGLGALGKALGLGSGAGQPGQAGRGGSSASRAGGGGGPSWLERLQQWTSQQLAGLNDALMSEREKAIDKLMGLLDSDPDEGLKYALPLGGDAHRGVANPGSRLSANDVNFNLNRLGGGGGPADNWDLDAQVRQQLTARYGELANRELRLGRHRRAAYIFGELLHDVSAAASALEQGKHWREAAVLYRERLRHPHAAARCYENGGLWTEACEIYEEMEEFEKAGDILLRLEQPDEAREQYRKEVVKRRSRAEMLMAARILETKLEAVDEAIDELESAWPATSQAGPCMQEMFALLGRHARHEDAAQRIRKLRDEVVPHQARIKQIEIITAASVDYPDRNVQLQAADDTRVLASRMLTGGQAVESQRVLAAVRCVAPEDRLLGRDCQRFDERRNVPAALPTLKSSHLARTAKLVHQYQIPWKNLNWKAAISSANMVFAAGVFHGHLKLFRYAFDGQLAPQQFSPNLQCRLPDPEILLAVNGNQPHFVLTHPYAGPAIAEEFEFPETGRIAYRTRAGALNGMSDSLLGAVHSGYDLIWLLELRSDLLTMIGVRTSGEVIVTQTLDKGIADLASHFDQGRFVPMFANSRRTYVGIGSELSSFRRGIQISTVDLHSPIYALAGTPPNTRSRVAASLEQGGVIFWDDSPDGTQQSFSPSLSQPKIACNRGGMLIAASGRSGEVYATQDLKVRLEAEVEFPSDVVAVTSDISPNRFSVLLQSGEIRQYEVPS